MIAKVNFTSSKTAMLREMENAKSSILLVSAALKSDAFVTCILEKAQYGCAVCVLLDAVKESDAQKPLQDLKSSAAQVFFLQAEKQMRFTGSFCIIDEQTVVLHSNPFLQEYEENELNTTLMISENPELLGQFTRHFNILLEQFSNKPKNAMSANQLLKRLEIFKNYILLEEFDEIDGVVSKIQKHSQDERVKSILQDVQNKNFSKAIQAIDQYISNNKQLTLFQDLETEVLKEEIQSLEDRIIDLYNERRALDSVLYAFKRRHHLELGEIISKILRIRKLQVNDNEEEFKQAEADEKAYNEQFESEKKKKVYDLNEDEKKALTKAYHKAVKQCHPDKFTQESPEMQRQAQEMMVELVKAQEQNDIVRVNEILESLEKGILNTDKAGRSKDKIKLQAVLNHLKKRITALENDINEIKSSKEFQKIIKIEDWAIYFDSLNKTLGTELENLESTLQLKNKWYY